MHTTRRRSMVWRRAVVASCTHANAPPIRTSVDPCGTRWPSFGWSVICSMTTLGRHVADKLGFHFANRQWPTDAYATFIV